MFKIIKSNLSLIIFLIASLLVIPLVYTPFTLDPALISRFLSLAILSLVFCIYILVKIIRDPHYFDLSILRQPIFPVWAIYIFFVGISIISAENISEAVVDFLKHFTVFIYFIITVLVLSKTKAFYDILSKMVTLFSIIILSIGLYQIYGLLNNGEFDHQASYQVSALFAHRNLFSQVLLLTLPFLVFCIFNYKGFWKISSLISGIVTLLFITFLLTKSVWLALVISFLFTAVLGIIVFYKRIKERRSYLKRALVLLIILSCILTFSGVLFIKVAGKEVLEKQTYWLRNSQFGSSKERLELWKKSVDMIKENPLTGIGTGNWKILISKYGTKDLRSEKGDIFFQRPHNDFLWVLSETGIAAFAFYLSIFILSFIYLIRTLRKSQNNTISSFILMMFSFLISYMIISMLSFPRERTEHTIFLILCLSSIVVVYQDHTKKRSPLKVKYVMLTSVPVMLLILSAITTGFLRFSGELHAHNAIKYRAMNEWHKVIREIDKGYSMFFTVDHTSTPLYFYRGVSNYNLGQIDEALSDFRESSIANPYHLHVLNNMGTCYALQKKHNESISYYKKALMISPQFENTLLNLCVSYIKKNNNDSAYVFLTKCDPDTKNPSYSEYASIILSDIIKKQISETNDRLIRINLNRIRNSDEWMNKVFKQALEKNTSYRDQVLTETIYLLESVDSVITAEQSKKYMKEFGLIN